MLRWLDNVPTVPLAIAAAVMALSPPLSEPHLWGKLKMLAAGRLVEPIDIFDFILHAILPVMLVLKFLRERAASRSKRR